MKTTIRDAGGRSLGTISEVGSKKTEARDNGGRLLGYFDGKYTRDTGGRILASGDITASLLTS
jgi:hypothetical protein